MNERFAPLPSEAAMASYGQFDSAASPFQSYPGNDMRQLIMKAYSALLRNQSIVIPIVINLFAFAVYRYLSSPWRRLPPGPTGYPLIGSVRRFVDLRWLIYECPKHGACVDYDFIYGSHI